MYASMFEIFLLVTALSADAFAAGFAYGAGRIRLPLPSVLILTGISSLTLLASLLAGRLAAGFLPAGVTGRVSFILLFVMGIVKLFEGSDRKRAEEADKNRDAVLSPAEAAVLGAALSLDSIAAGIGAGIGVSHILAAFAASFLVGALAVRLGGLLGRLAASRCSLSMGWLGGVLLLLLAFMKIL